MTNKPYTDYYYVATCSLPQSVRTIAATQATMDFAINTQVKNQFFPGFMGATGYEYAHAHLDSEAVSGKFEADLQALVAQGGRA